MGCFLVRQEENEVCYILISLCFYYTNPVTCVHGYLNMIPLIKHCLQLVKLYRPSVLTKIIVYDNVVARHQYSVLLCVCVSIVCYVVYICMNAAVQKVLARMQNVSKNSYGQVKKCSY